MKVFLHLTMEQGSWCTGGMKLIRDFAVSVILSCLATEGVLFNISPDPSLVFSKVSDPELMRGVVKLGCLLCDSLVAFLCYYILSTC